MTFEHSGTHDNAQRPNSAQSRDDTDTPLDLPFARLKLSPSAISRLQRFIGNQAVTRLVGRATTPTPPMRGFSLYVQRAFPFDPTTDKNHPAMQVLLAKNNIANFGPWKLRPMKGDWDYTIPTQAGGVLPYLKRLRTHMESQNDLYEPEKIANIPGPVTWKNPITNANVTLKGGIVKADSQRRVAVATAELQGKELGRRYLEMLKINKGSTTRAFANIAEEDQFGANVDAHIQDRHVLGGAQMPDAQAIAWRAAFGELGGPANPVGGGWAAYDPTASAFNTTGAANADIAAALNAQFFPNWKAHRETLLTAAQISIRTNRGGGAVTGYRNPAGARYGDDEKPTYLSNAHKGERPLYYPDAAWDAWAAKNLDAKKTDELKNQPLTVDASGALPVIQLYIVPTDTPNAGGWVVKTAYPTA